MRDDDAGARHRRDIDRVVADAVPRDDAQPAIGACHGGGGDPRQIDVQRVVARGVVGGDFPDDFRQVLPLDAGCAVEDGERRGAERRLAARVEDVAREPDLQGPGHRAPPRGRPDARSTSRPWPSARCSIS